MPEMDAGTQAPRKSGKLSEIFHEVPTWGWWAAGAAALAIVIFKGHTAASSSAGAAGPVSLGSYGVPSSAGQAASAAGYAASYDQSAAEFAALQKQIQDQNAALAPLQHDHQAAQLAKLQTDQATLARYQTLLQEAPANNDPNTSWYQSSIASLQGIIAQEQVAGPPSP